MCITSEPAKMSATNILVAPSADGKHQLTVYSNNTDNFSRRNAMILPVLLPESIKLVNMKSYINIFKDCEDSFPTNLTESLCANEYTSNSSNELLRVIQCGSYKASIGMSINDLDKIDENVFKLSTNCRAFLEKHYNEKCWGFIVCCLDTGKKTYEPFAYTHQLVADKLFIPTRHFHGHLDKKDVSKDWDHTIYTYDSGEYGWITQSNLLRDRTEGSMIEFYKIGFDVKENAIFNKYSIFGTYPNSDLTARLIHQQN